MYAIFYCGKTDSQTATVEQVRPPEAFSKLCLAVQSPSCAVGVCSENNLPVT
jgi:hypothetical protein